MIEDKVLITNSLPSRDLTNLSGEPSFSYSQNVDREVETRN